MRIPFSWRLRAARSRALALAALAAVSATTGIAPASRAQLPAGGWASPGVEWVGNVALPSLPGTLAATKLGGYFYVIAADGLHIFDVSEPTSPRRVGYLARGGPAGWPQQLGYPELDSTDTVATNGRIVLLPRDVQTPSVRPVVYVIDVTDKTAPRVIATAPSSGYGVTCVLGCRWAYVAGGGSIIDLRDPAKPRFAGNWAEDLETRNPPLQAEGATDVTEVAPGLVLTGSIPMYLLDARRDPANPRVVATSDGSPHSFGSVAWPGFPSQPIVLSRSEGFLAPHCAVRDALKGTTIDAAFKTWDASGWQQTGLITGIDDYYVANGTYTDGEPAFSGAIPSAWGCGPSTFDVHPDFRRSRLVATAWHSHGIKFLRIDDDGEIERVGWFLPYEPHDSFGVRWINHEIAYALDYPRGIDILRVDLTSPGS